MIIQLDGRMITGHRYKNLVTINGHIVCSVTTKGQIVCLVTACGDCDIAVKVARYTEVRVNNIPKI